MTQLQAPGGAAFFMLTFRSLFNPGRALMFPCDASGTVDLDRLQREAKLNYLAARALIGREYAYPCVSVLDAA